MRKIEEKSSSIKYLETMSVVVRLLDAQREVNNLLIKNRDILKKIMTLIDLITAIFPKIN